MKKILVFGAEHSKQKILEKLQEVGVVHVVAADPKEVKANEQLLQEEEHINKALSILRTFPKESEQAAELPQNLCENVIAQQTDIFKLEEQQKDIKQRLENLLHIWGEFSSLLLQGLKNNGVYFQFCKISAQSTEELADGEVYRKIIGKNAFVVTLTRDGRKKLPANVEEIFMQEGTVELQAKLEKIEASIATQKQDLQTKTSYIDFLEKRISKIADEITLSGVNSKLFSEKDIFALKGFLPNTKVEQLQEKMTNLKVAVVIEDAKEEDNPPTLIQNPKWIQSVVDLVKLYATPGYGEWDSSTSIYLAFTIFFSMIVGDAGYGCVLLLLMFGLRSKMQSAEAGQRVYRLMVTLSIGCIVFGALSGNWFAIELSADNPLKSLHVLGNSKNPDENLNNMMTLSIYIGAIHLSIGRLIQIARLFPSSLWINQLGWLLMMWGAIAKLAWKNEYGMHAMIAGATLAVLFATRHRNLIKRLVIGLADLLGVTQNFSDVLSYLRLFALGLASTVMAKIFNDLGMQIREVSVVGPVLMVLVIFMGHTINLVLAVMGGFIHGLRLNFLEFYRYCFEGIGYDYQPFTKKSQ